METFFDRLENLNLSFRVLFFLFQWSPICVVFQLVLMR